MTIENINLIDLETKDLRYVLSYIYGKKAAKLYIDRGFRLYLGRPDKIEIIKK